MTTITEKRPITLEVSLDEEQTIKRALNLARNGGVAVLPESHKVSVASLANRLAKSYDDTIALIEQSGAKVMKNQFGTQFLSADDAESVVETDYRNKRAAFDAFYDEMSKYGDRD